ncbi:peptidoglycan/xylan/chitin deacetylase (PgdA/CDA1 family) [Thermocatellispora tengchongensis]|uniref:Peptidoglycan/xylan/chitin deacetylase (PgdA/CDA1 family) n=1 Tax=Thermocatellispora tengchongensis TaxID=1073253 RepID=A0A840P014_9ACTN|nr:polysaccharide deacetylase family protein [Thermocatellispora tengchongensis]MBB5131796.1 peptidoglycan/xylan/chitin deacetylase (PgdA/CDA1 family) [Thermocatellispora tengchongensis]
MARVVAVANVVVVSVAIMVLTFVPVGDRPQREAVPARPQAERKTERPAPHQEELLPSSALPPPVRATRESARRARANEAGLVPVLMYHRIVAKPRASIDRTPAQVRAELERLAREGYVPITAREFASGEIGVPEGTHPVVLTFDDGHSSHFGLDADGMPLPDTAVGIIFAVAQKYPRFRPVATFWVNREPFGLRDPDRQAHAVRWLTAHGFEVANHTWGHPNLRRVSKKKAREQIVRGERLLRRLGAGPSATLALPYGSRPRDPGLARSGSWDGTKYDYKGVFLAGAEPSPPPFVKGFDRNAIMRIQSNGRKGECRRWCSAYWLDWLADHKGKRYTSDGDPERISIPEKLRGNITGKRRQQVNAY